LNASKSAFRERDDSDDRHWPDARTSKDASLIEEWKKKLPVVTNSVPARARWESDPAEDSRPVVIEWDLREKPAEVDFFPYASSEFEVGGTTERVPAPEGKVQIRKRVKKLEGDWPKELAGLLVSRAGNGGPSKAIEVKLPIGGFTTTAQAAARWVRFWRCSASRSWAD
jgi:hypothetical protein